MLTWQADGVRFGTDSDRVRLTASELGKRITVTVAGSLDGYDPATVVSQRTVSVAAGTLTGPKPRISGTAAVGRTLTVVAGRWTQGTQLTYPVVRER